MAKFSFDEASAPAPPAATFSFEDATAEVGPKAPPPPAKEPLEPLGDPSGAGDFAAIASQPTKSASVLERPELAHVLDRTVPTAKDVAGFEERERRAAMPSIKAGPGPRPDPMADKGAMFADAPGVVRAGVNASAAGAEALWGGVQGAADLVGADKVSDVAGGAAKASRTFQDAMGKPKPAEGFGPNSPESYLRDMGEGAVSSLAQSASLARAFGAKAVIPLMSVMSGSQQYAKARDAGLDPASAFANAVPYGTFEAIGEKFEGLDKAAAAMNVILSKGASAQAKRTAGEALVRAGIREVPGEVVTYLGQSGIDKLPGIGLNPNMTMEQFIDGLRDTVVQATMMGGAMAGGGHGAAHAQPKAEPTAEELARRKGFLVQAERIKQLKAAGETAVAETLQRRLDTQQADDEMGAFASQPWAKDADFQTRYRDMRIAGMKPGEAGARAAHAHAFNQLGAQVGLSQEAIDQALEAARKQPIDKVPKFLDTFTSAVLTAKGQEAPAGTVHDVVQSLGDAAMETALGHAYDSPKATSDAILDLEKKAEPKPEPAPAEASIPEAKVITPGMQAFPPESGTLGMARDALPQVQAEHHGPLVNFLNARGVQHEVHSLDPNELKPTQAEYDPAKVRALAGVKGDGSILVSQDGFILDGHHRWLAAKEAGEPIKAIVLQAPVHDLIEQVKEFPSANAEKAQGEKAQAENSPTAAPDQAAEGSRQAPGADTRADPAGADSGGRAAAVDEILGRDYEAITEGGKPFKLEAEARKARKKVPHMRVVRHEGGFALAPKTPAQLAAEEKAAKRLSLPNTGAAGAPISAHAFLADHGGLSREAKAEIGIDTNVRIGNRTLFAGNGKGLTLAQASELLHQHGYMPNEGENEASELIQKSLRSPQYTAEGWKMLADAEEHARFEDHLKAQQGQDNDLVVLQEEYLKNTGADELTAAERDELNAAIAAAQAEGIDTEALLEDAARKAENGTAHDYYREATSSLQAAPRAERQGNAAGARAEQGRPAAQPEGSRSGSEVSREQGARRSDEGKPQALKWEVRPTGTLAVHGDPAKIRDILKDIPAKSFMVMDGGYMIGRTQVDKAVRILEGKPEETKAAKPLSIGTTPGDAEPVTVKDGIVHIGKHEAIDFESGDPVKVKAGASDADIKQALKDAGVMGKRLKFYGGDAKDVLTAPTKQDVLAQQDRARDAQALDDKAQIDREAKHQTLTAPERPDERKDSSGDMFAREKAQAEIDKKNAGKQQDANPDQDGLFARSEPFYSALSREVGAIDAKAMPAEGWANRVKGLINAGKVKADEVEWSGLDDFLKLQQGKVTKDQVMQFLRDNGVQVHEVTKSSIDRAGEEKRRAELNAMPLAELHDEAESAGIDPESGNRADLIDDIIREEGAGEDDGASDNTKYGQFTLPGGTNYREVLLTLPEAGHAVNAEYDVARRDHADALSDYKQTTELYGKPDHPEVRDALENLKEKAKRLDEVKQRIDKLPLPYKSGHWDESNILAHIRLNDRTDADGKKVLFVEELQSDWAQAGRKQGFKKGLAFSNFRDWADEKGLSAGAQARIWEHRFLEAGKDDWLTPAERVLANEWSAFLTDVANDGSRPPRAPFVEKTDAWLSLALKRIIKMAADEGYDRVAFVSGEQSAERYDLSKHIDSMDVRKIDNGKLMVYANKNNEQVLTKMTRPEGLADVIGKDMARRVLEDIEAGRPTQYRGLDLKTGGEGMKSFYDKIVPAAANKLLARIGGGKMGDVSLSIEKSDRDGPMYDYESGAPIGQRGAPFIVTDRDGKEMARFDTRAEAAAETDRLNAATASAMAQPGFDITDAIREKVSGGLPLFKRGEGGESVASQQRVAMVEKIIADATKGFKGLPEYKVVPSYRDLPVTAPPDARGFYRDGKVWIVAGADFHGPGAAMRRNVLTTFAHEVTGHFGTRALLGDEHSRFLKNIDMAIKAGNKAITAIRDQVDAVYTDDHGEPNLSALKKADEIAARVVENAIDADGNFKPGFGFVKAVYSKIAQWLREHGINVNFTHAELQGILVRALRRVEQGPQTEHAQPAFAFATGKPRENTLKALSQNDDLFQLPKSDKKDIEGIAADNDPQLKVEQIPSVIATRTEWRVTFPDGQKATITLRPHDDKVDRHYDMQLLSGDASSVETERPGKGGENVKKDDVWIDASKMTTGKNGALLYNIAATFAHNTGRIFIGDPAGLSDDALRRRTEHMLSSALKFGTTEHLAPHPRQTRGEVKLGIPPLRWTYGDDLGNIESLIRVSRENTHAHNPVTFERRTGRFVDSQGRELDDGAIRQVAELGPHRESRAGVATLKRGAVLDSLVRQQGSQGSAAGRRNGVLEELLELAGQPASPAHGAFYARNGVTPDTRTVEVDGERYPIKNSRGQPIAGTVEKTRAFWRKFADSKAVDEHGRPVMVLHGTPKGDVKFEARERGLYFTSSPTLANGYTYGNFMRGGNERAIYPAYVVLKNPLVIDALGARNDNIPFPGVEWKQKVFGNLPKNAVNIEEAFKRAIAMGHDGLIVKNTADTNNIQERTKGDVYAVKDPAQVIPAYRAGDEDAAFARGGAAPARDLFHTDTWSATEPTKLDKVIYELQDGRIDLRRIQQAIHKAGADIPEKFDARLAETLYPGRVVRRAEQFLDLEVKPLLKAMAEAKVTMAELADYLIARHAPERNAQVAKVNPKLPDGGAGRNSAGELMTNDAARAYIAAIPAARKAQLDELASKVDDITKGTRNLLVTEGLEKADTVDAWQAAYQHYVPLFKDEAEHPHPQGMGFTVKGPASKRATGSTKQVTDVIAHVLMQREAAITRAEKNRVGLALYGLALSNPNPEFWTTIKPSMTNEQIGHELQAMGVDPTVAEAGMRGVPTIRTVDPVLNRVVDRPNPIYKSLPGAITLKLNGEDRVLMLNEKSEVAMRMAENLKNLDGLTKLDLANSVVGKATRWLASVNTQYNPAFGLVNLTRDVMEGSINVGSTQLRGKGLRVLGNVPMALQGIARQLSTDGGGEWGRLFKQFQDDGGRTGYREMFATAEDRAKAIEKELAAAEKAGTLTAGKVGHAVLDLLDGFNTTLENATRLAAYKVALDEGLTRPEAARLARELTVDFNRKGRAGRELGPLYAFFNASVQGAERAARTLAGPTGGKVLAGGLMLGVMQALMLAVAGYDDDEIPEWVKTRAFIIPLPEKDGKKRFVSIPMPLGFLWIPNAGRVMTELTLNGGKDMGKRAFQAVGELVGSFSPFGGGNPFTADGALRLLAPTVVDPVIELGFNKNFAGNTISKESPHGETDNRPGFQRAKEATQRTLTGQAYIGIAKAINTLTGGTPYEKGIASPTPEQVHYLAQVIGGGVLREIEKGIDMAARARAGEPTKTSQIPLVARFTGEVDNDQVEQARYRERDKNLKTLNSSLTAAKQAGDGEAMARMITEHPELAMMKAYEKVDRELTKLNKQVVSTVDDPAGLKALDDARVANMKALNDAMKNLEQASGKVTLGQKLKGALKQPEVATAN
jgi:hypothetical protein